MPRYPYIAGVSCEEPSIPITSLASLPLAWPDDDQIRTRAQGFIDDLRDPTLVADCFVVAFRDDLDGEGTEREDLALIAEDRMRVWGADDDAVARAFEIVRWMWRELLPTIFEGVDLPALDGLEDARWLARELAPPLEIARDAWLEKYRSDEECVPEWALYSARQCAQSAAHDLSFVQRRANPTKFRPKLRAGDHPMDHCQRAASGAAGALVYGCVISPRLATTLARLGGTAYRERGVGSRARHALSDTGITQFGPLLERLATELVNAYDAAVIRQAPSNRLALDVAEVVLDRHRAVAVAMLAESPQLSGRPLPGGSETFHDAAWDVLERAGAEIALKIHAMTPAPSS